MPGRGSYGPGGKWVYQRAKHIRSKNPDMEESTSFAIATQQAHKLGKSPKKFRTEQGVARAHEKYQGPVKEYKKTAESIQKTGMDAGSILTGLAAGVPVGRSVAGHTAAGMAPRGRITRSEDIARKAALIGAPIGGIAALALAKKYGLGLRAATLLARKAPKGLLSTPDVDQTLLRIALPAALGIGGSAAGGLATGGIVGGIQKMRGSPYQTKTAMFHGFFDELEKISQDPLGGSAAPASMPAPSTPQQDPASMIGRKAPNMGGGTSPPGAGAPSMPGTGIGT